MKYLENDKLDLLIKLSFCNRELPEVEEFKNIDDSNVVLSNRYYAKKKRIINKYKRRPAMLTFKKIMSVASAACLIIVLSLGICVVSVSSLRNAVWNAIVEWYEDYITVRYVTPYSDYLQSDVEATYPASIETVKKPTYLPEGVEEKLVVKGDARISYEYCVSDKFAFLYTQSVCIEDEKYFDNENVQMKEIEVGDNIFLLINNSEKSLKTLLWTDNVYTYLISFESDNLDEMIKIAQSVE